MSAAEGSFFSPRGNSSSIALTVLCDGYVYLLTPSSLVPVFSLYILLFLSFSPLQVPNKTTGHWTLFYYWKPGRWQISSPKQPSKVRPALNREREIEKEEARGRNKERERRRQADWWQGSESGFTLGFSLTPRHYPFSCHTQTHTQSQVHHTEGVWWHKMEESPLPDRCILQELELSSWAKSTTTF